MLFILRNLFLTTEANDFPAPLAQLPNDWKTEADSLRIRLKYNGDIHFIIGPWGSGKSTFISTLLNDKDYFKRPQRISLSTATTQDEIFSHIIRATIKFIYLAIAIGTIAASFSYYTLPEIYSKLIAENPSFAFFTAAFLSLFITNRFRLFYIISSYLEPILGRQTKIIEDYDRGNLDETEIYNTLIFRNKWRTSYVVLIGWKSEIERDDYIDLGLKLGSDITLFDSNPDITYKIFSNLYKSPPYIAKGEWVRIFTPRKIISLVTYINSISHTRDTDDSVKLLWLVIFNELVKFLAIEDLELIGFESDGRSLSGQLRITSHQREMINSFLRSLDPTLFASLTAKSGNYGNQGQVFSRNLFIKQISGIPIPNIVKY